MRGNVKRWRRERSRKGIALTMGFILLLVALSGCGGGPEGNGEQKPDMDRVELSMKPEEYPRVDGSTATIPLSEAFGAAVMGLSLEDARPYIQHNTTHNAYVNLIDGNADIIFVTAPSSEELDYAAQMGVTLEVIPIVSEGFIFLTNKDNPVDSLAFDQIKDIYRGNITNWKDVGGKDDPIVAYQRPVNSGSQTGMYDLVLPADEMMEAPTELQVQGMGELVDAVAEYSEGTGAIGYSYYYYVTDMWSSVGTKILKVDGVYPDKDTIGDGSYPIRTAYYAVVLESTPEDSGARKLLSWILSEGGQQTAEEAGYVKLGEK